VKFIEVIYSVLKNALSMATEPEGSISKISNPTTGHVLSQSHPHKLISTVFMLYSALHLDLQSGRFQRGLHIERIYVLLLTPPHPRI
jgi:hypothetical protein